MNILSRHAQVLQDAVLRSHALDVAVLEDRMGDARMQRMTGMEVAALCACLVALLVSHNGLPPAHDTAARALVALLVIFSVRRVLALDELQRRIKLVALAMVATSTWLGMIACGLLQYAGMRMPPLSLGFLAMVALYGVARRWAQRYYA